MKVTTNLENKQLGYGQIVMKTGEETYLRVEFCVGKNGNAYTMKGYPISIEKLIAEHLPNIKNL